MLTTSLQELKSLNSCLRDEHCALQLAFASLEEKLRKVQVITFHWIEIILWISTLNFYLQDENRTLVERLIKYKAKDAEKLNEENESFLKYVQNLVSRNFISGGGSSASMIKSNETDVDSIEHFACSFCSLFILWLRLVARSLQKLCGSWDYSLHLVINKCAQSTKTFDLYRSW